MKRRPLSIIPGGDERGPLRVRPKRLEDAGKATLLERYLNDKAASREPVTRLGLEIELARISHDLATMAPVMTADGMRPMNHDAPCPHNGCERSGAGDVTVDPCGPGCTFPRA